MDYIIDSTKDNLNSIGGLAFIGKIFEKIGFGVDSANISHPAILKSIAGLFVQGRAHFEEIRLFRNNNFFKNSLDLDYVPAAETIRLYMEKMILEEDQVNNHITESNIELLKKQDFTQIVIENNSYLPVDIDTSPFDNSKSKKEGVSRTYKKFDGFHPIFSYIGNEGYMLNCELREGKQHCQNGTPDFLKRTNDIIAKLKTSAPILFRLDGGNDAKETLRVLNKSGHFFIVKRNLRKELREYWLSVAKAESENIYRNDKKIIYTGYHTGKTPGNDPDFPLIDVIYKVTEIIKDENGNALLFPEIKVETYWTNLYERPENIIELYHQHGTSEQFHSELKSDMNFERLPSGKFIVNSMLLQVAMICFNTLRFIGQTALKQKKSLPYKTKVIRKRLRKIIDDLIRVAIKIVRHAGSIKIKLWENNPWLECFKKVYQVCCNL
ncbi:MAG: IS1380 family transposase [Desulfobacterales bacterium]|nr:IS1380 family transposase [Desulfobacterales bacterium]